ncbi:MAG: glycosyltransferase family A protein [Pseudomonadota bacterium]
MSISIVLPVFNAARTLDECLDSIHGQTVTDYELLVVDDHCTDGSTEILQGRVAADGRIRIVPNEGRGLIDALNTGFNSARGDYVARMDADDLMRPTRLACQQDYLAAYPDIAAVGSRVHVFPEREIGPGCREYLRWQDACASPAAIANEIYREAPLANPSAMLRRQVVLDVGGYRDGAFPEDYEFWLRLIHLGYSIGKHDEILLDWRVDASSHSRTHPRYRRPAFDQVRVRYLALDKRLDGDRKVVFWGAGRKTRQRSKLLVEAGCQPIAYVDIDPRKVGNRLQGVPVVSPDWLWSREPRPFVLNYVVNHGAPELIGEELKERGFEKGRDFLHVG